MNNHIPALNILSFFPPPDFLTIHPKYLHSPSPFLSMWEGSAFLSFPKKRHEFMNPRSVTTVIDYFSHGGGPAEMSRDLAQSGVYFLD